MSKDRELTKDVIQEVFLELWEQPKLLESVAHPFAYIRKMFYRKMIRKLKLDAKTIHSDEEDFPELASPSYEELLINFQQTVDQKTSLAKALLALPDQQREMLYMRFFKELSYADIATNTGKSKRTVYNQIYEAIKKLKQSMLVLVLVLLGLIVLGS